MLNRIQLFDSNRNPLAVAMIEKRGELYSGTVDTAGMPLTIRQIFERYETLINNQVLSLLDGVETEIENLGIVAVNGDEIETALEDVQLFPNSKKISFKAAARSGHPVLR